MCRLPTLLCCRAEDDDAHSILATQLNFFEKVKHRCALHNRSGWLQPRELWRPDCDAKQIRAPVQGLSATLVHMHVSDPQQSLESLAAGNPQPHAFQAY